MPIQPPRFNGAVSNPVRLAAVLAFRWLVSLVREHGLDGILERKKRCQKEEKGRKGVRKDCLRS